MEPSNDNAILVGMGSNLPSTFGPPHRTLEAAIKAMASTGIEAIRLSSFWKTRPVPESDQPWFVNAVVALATALSPHDLLTCLNGIEADFGRRRGVVNQARTLDLDLLAYGRRIIADERLTVPHPRLSLRAFVLIPLREVAPDWRHPVTGEGIEAMIARLPTDQTILPDA